MFVASNRNAGPRMTTLSSPIVYGWSPLRPGHGERLAGGAGDLALDQLVGDVIGEVAKVRDAPQAEDRGRAVLDERAHVVREPEAGHLDRVGLAGSRDHLGRREDADRGRRDDDLEVRVRLEQALGLGGAICGSSSP